MSAMSSTIPDIYITALSVEQTVISSISTLSAIYFTYGLYVLLFGIYIHMMRSRNRPGEGRSSNLYPILTVVLFVLSTLLVVNETACGLHGGIIRFTAVRNRDYDLLERYQHYDDFQRKFGSSTQLFLFFLLNVAAEWMLIHRCHLIWGSNKLVAVPLVIASVSINACGLTGYILQSIALANFTTPSLNTGKLLTISINLTAGYTAASVVNNIIITLLTAGRIWWIHRQIRIQGVYTTDKLVQSISRVILESGIIYPFMNVACLVLRHSIPPEKRSFDAFPIAALSAGIAPTLIMVRAKLGQNVESLQEAVSDIRFTSQPAQRELGGTTTIQIQAQVLPAARIPGLVKGGKGQIEDAIHAKESPVIV